jgi:hypothetical protein
VVHPLTRLARRGSAAALLAALSACRTEAPPPPRPVVIWQQVGAWTGRGNKQTETFTSDTGGFRLRWETTRETAPGAGTLKVVFRSGDSGREIIDALDVHGAGRDTTYVAAERPRWYYLTIESANVDWSLAVDERIEGQATTGRF